MSEETWLNVMPAIPLARGVPVVDTSDVDLVLDCITGLTVDGEAVSAEYFIDDHWRPDLDDPQGFGYALRWLGMQPDGRDLYCWHGADEWVSRHLSGQTTDADRLALAQAIAKVTR